MCEVNVLVLMSTYNGEKYLREQLESIFQQRDVHVSLFIRDDGSKDGTVSILREYENFPNCTIEYGHNIGAKNSFFWLIENSPDCEYYSFSDQDDVWDEDKLSVAIRTLMKFKSVLYHGLAGRVDSDLRPLDNEPYSPINSFGSSLLTSSTGCTMVFSRALMETLKSYIPKDASMHDAWVYRVAYALDYPVYYDTVSHMKYRQHGNNVSGGQMSFTKKIKKVLSNKSLKYNVAKEILMGFGDKMSSVNLNLLRLFLSYRNSVSDKFRVITCREFRVKKKVTNFQNALLFVFNLI